MADLPSWLSAFVALIALGVSIFTTIQNSRTRARTAKLEASNAEIARAQATLAQQAWSDEYFREISNWASGVATCLSRAIHQFDDLAEASATRTQILADISCAIDTGRWFFPNHISDDYGNDKPPAYRGYRQPILDWLVRAYEILETPGKFEEPREQLVRSQRVFVSMIQERLDPRRREVAIGRVLSEFEGLNGLEQPKAPEKQ